MQNKCLLLTRQFGRFMKILVVDDELDICEILQYNLETEGRIAHRPPRSPHRGFFKEQNCHVPIRFSFFSL